MKSTLIEALPLFVGAALGVYFFNSTIPLAVVALILGLFVVLGLLAYSIAKVNLRKRPETAVRIWQLQVLAPTAVIAAAGYGAASLTAALPELIAMLPFIDLPAAVEARTKKLDGIAAAFAAAATSFLGALFLDDLEKGEGGLWPPAQIKLAFRETFGADVTDRRQQFERRRGEEEAAHHTRLIAEAEALGRYETFKAAVHMDTISIVHPKGWTFPGALARAKIVKQNVDGG